MVIKITTYFRKENQEKVTMDARKKQESWDCVFHHLPTEKLGLYETWFKLIDFSYVNLYYEKWSASFEVLPGLINVLMVPWRNVSKENINER